MTGQTMMSSAHVPEDLEASPGEIRSSVWFLLNFTGVRHPEEAVTLTVGWECVQIGEIGHQL